MRLTLQTKRPSRKSQRQSNRFLHIRFKKASRKRLAFFDRAIQNSSTEALRVSSSLWDDYVLRSACGLKIWNCEAFFLPTGEVILAQPFKLGWPFGSCLSPEGT